MNKLKGFIFGSLAGILTITVSQVIFDPSHLQWTSPTENVDGTPLVDLAGFRIFCTTIKGDYSSPVIVHDLFNPNLTNKEIDDIFAGKRGRFFCSMSAYNEWYAANGGPHGESGLSNEITIELTDGGVVIRSPKPPVLAVQ